MGNVVRNWIYADAPRYGLDPRAVASVGMVESGLRRYAVGDHGTSYGPFQLHRGGALPRGKGRRWAGSRRGVNYALKQMAKSARGKKGHRAISHIVRRFERPANPGREEALARQWYAKSGGKLQPTGMPQYGRRSPRVSKTMRRSRGNKKQLANFIMSSMGQLASGGQVDPFKFAQGLMNMPMSGGRSAPRRRSVGPPLHNLGGGKASRGGLKDLFYDPMGYSYDEGNRWNKTIGHHRDHVHVSANNPRTMLAMIKRARRMGLSTRENPYVDRVDPVHVKGSDHYKNFKGRYRGRRLGEALDVSGNPRRMKAYFKWARRFRKSRI